jgi:hypothetical protein
MWLSMHTHYKHRKFDKNRSIMKDTLLAEDDFCPYLDYSYIEATQTSYVGLPTHALQPAQDSSKPVSNKQHFTPVDETVFCPFLNNDCTGATQTSRGALPTHAQQPAQVCSK